jgi:hypothetical protein
VVDPTSMMEPETTHKLMRAIAALRDEIGRLIDEQLAPSEERSSEPIAEPPPSPPVASVVNPPIAVAEVRELPPTEVAPPVSPAAAESDPAEPRRRGPLARPRPRETASAASAAPAPAGRPDDPRQRLDALAKLLDRRLKQPAGNPAEATTCSHHD